MSKYTAQWDIKHGGDKIAPNQIVDYPAAEVAHLVEMGALVAIAPAVDEDAAAKAAAKAEAKAAAKAERERKAAEAKAAADAAAAKGAE